MLVRLSDATLADQLLAFLHRADCFAELREVEALADGVAVKVDVPNAFDEPQARLEVALYLRVWEAVHPRSGVELLD